MALGCRFPSHDHGGVADFDAVTDQTKYDPKKLAKFEEFVDLLTNLHPKAKEAVADPIAALKATSNEVQSRKFTPMTPDEYSNPELGIRPGEYKSANTYKSKLNASTAEDLAHEKFGPVPEKPNTNLNAALEEHPGYQQILEELDFLKNREPRSQAEVLAQLPDFQVKPHILRNRSNLIDKGLEPIKAGEVGFSDLVNDYERVNPLAAGPDGLTLRS